MCRCGCSPLFPPSEEAALPVNGSTLGTGTFTTYAVIQTGQSLDYALRRKFCSLMSRAYLQILVAMEKFGLWQLKLFNGMIVVAALHAVHSGFRAVELFFLFVPNTYFLHPRVCSYLKHLSRESLYRSEKVKFVLRIK